MLNCMCMHSAPAEPLTHAPNLCFEAPNSQPTPAFVFCSFSASRLRRAAIPSGAVEKLHHITLHRARQRRYSGTPLHCIQSQEQTAGSHEIVGHHQSSLVGSPPSASAANGMHVCRMQETTQVHLFFRSCAMARRVALNLSRRKLSCVLLCPFSPRSDEEMVL
jgi:hypothetical protein